MNDPMIAAAARRHLSAAARTLDPVPGVDLAAYADDLIARFANPNIAHRTAQIAMDGTQKLPTRVFEPARELLAQGGDGTSFALITAAWMLNVSRIGGGNEPDTRQDPRWEEIRAALPRPPPTAQKIVDALFDLPGPFPTPLREHEGWRMQIVALLEQLREAGLMPLLPPPPRGLPRDRLALSEAPAALAPAANSS